MKNYITAQGFEGLKTEIRKLLNEDRPELVKVISWAASNGDRSENGDYIYGKRKLREIDRRIRFLSKRLEAAEIVDCAKQDRSRVLFGAKVVVLDEDEKKRTYRIVGEDEIDAKNGMVSWVSPIAKALLNSRVGDVVSLVSPQGLVELEIVQIDY
ncbi:MAG: transcription elongation factor GreB [Bdellovibrionia bacterium]